MNLSEALDAALPEIPQVRLSRERPPRLNPELVIREDVLDGERIIGVLQRERALYLRLTPLQWELSQLFDGERSFEEIAEIFKNQTGVSIDATAVKSFADDLEPSDFWHKSAQEKNLALAQKLATQRGRRAHSKIDLAHISFSAWDPDRYLGWLDRAIGRYIYSRWFVLLVVLLFIFESVVFVSQWNVLGPDTVLFFNFTRKSLQDLAQFWLLFLILGFFHESAHGLTCKHFGGQVHSMGLLFLYLTPAFYVDVTEIWISATKIQRLATIIAGIWIEMILCGIAMIVWTNTLAGEWLHDFAYQVILLTGFAVALINLNPLIKLDGYYFMTELIEIPDLKERSTAFLSSWFQAKVLGFPVEVPIVPRRRAPLFVIYALFSGLYSYTLLLLVVRLTYNILAHWMEIFALLPAGTLGYVIFRSRIRALRKATVEFWRRSEGSWSTRHTVVAALLALLVFMPIWRDRVDGYYVVEPEQSTVLHAAVQGRVDKVLVTQGETVHKGQPLIQMSSAVADSMRDFASAEIQRASFASASSQLEGRSIGPAAADQIGASRQAGLATEAESDLTIRATTDGVVLTQDPGLLRDQNVAAGQALMQIADTAPRMIRVFVPASGINRIPSGAEVAFNLPGEFRIRRVTLGPLGGDAVTLPPGLVAQQDFKGIQQGAYYTSKITLSQAGLDAMIGASGAVKVFGIRRSVTERLFIVALNLVKIHVW